MMPTTYEAFKQLGMRLDMSRGKPSPEQLDLSRSRWSNRMQRARRPICRAMASIAATTATASACPKRASSAHNCSTWLPPRSSLPATRVSS